MIIPAFTEIAPLAIGLLHFVGCKRSFSTSRASLTMYIQEQIKQNAIKPIIELTTAFRLISLPKNIRGTKTRMFFI